MIRPFAPLVLVLLAAAGGRAAPIVSLDVLTPSVSATGTGQLAVRLSLAAGETASLGVYTVQVSNNGGPVQFTGAAFPTPITSYVFLPTDSFSFTNGDPGPSADTFPVSPVATLNDFYVGANPSGDAPIGSPVAMTTYTLAVLTFQGTNTGGATTVQFSVLNPDFQDGSGSGLEATAGGPATVRVGAADAGPGGGPTPVPEPMTLALFAAAGAGAWRLRRRG